MTESQSQGTESSPEGLAVAAFRPSSSERAFVVQFDPVAGLRRRLHGRVEVVGSGEATRFHSLKQLIAFMVGRLRSARQ
jgi:hypothetical protein